jgi:hypothetical protein
MAGFPLRLPCGVPAQSKRHRASQEKESGGGMTFHSHPAIIASSARRLEPSGFSRPCGAYVRRTESTSSRNSPDGGRRLSGDTRRRRSMQQRYEYEFVRLGEGWMGVKKSAREEYQQLIRDYAREGWRLVQVFAPGTGGYGAAKYYELILEREVRY